MNLILLQPTLRAGDTNHNFDTIEALLANTQEPIAAEDIVVLPEHFTSSGDPGGYAEYLQELWCIAGCAIVGGSHHRTVGGKRMNVGAVLNEHGREAGNYSKLRPYSSEREKVTPGDALGEFRINGRNLLIVVCADFWYSDIILQTKTLPDMILVPSFSVSRKPSAEYSRSLWRHLAVTRAYEFGVFVGISDWSADSSLPQNRTCGVGGFADPTQIEPEKFFQPIKSGGISLFKLDFDALEEFRKDRRTRGFFWR